jgi:hypothetical protein
VTGIAVGMFVWRSRGPRITEHPKTKAKASSDRQLQMAAEIEAAILRRGVSAKSLT